MDRSKVLNFRTAIVLAVSAILVVVGLWNKGLFRKNELTMWEHSGGNKGMVDKLAEM